ncbi:hypothetical protein AMECASPLE_026838, partial [Ameca splendens]
MWRGWKEKEAIEAVSVGAILSDYQRVRVENVGCLNGSRSGVCVCSEPKAEKLYHCFAKCLRLGLQPLAYLWRRDQESLLSEMIKSDLYAILIKVAAF